MTQVTETPRIYVACLASYNNGILHGEWIDLDGDIDETWNRINAMLKASPVEDAEEWAIHDYEGFGFRPSEYESIEHVHACAEFILEHGEQGAILLDYYSDLEEAKNALENYAGAYEDLADFARELTEETTVIPDNLGFYIDYERMARDMEMSGDILSIQSSYNEVHVYWAH